MFFPPAQLQPEYLVNGSFLPVPFRVNRISAGTVFDLLHPYNPSDTPELWPPHPLHLSCILHSMESSIFSEPWNKICTQDLLPDALAPGDTAVPAYNIEKHLLTVLLPCLPSMDVRKNIFLRVLPLTDHIHILFPHPLCAVSLAESPPVSGGTPVHLQNILLPHL